MGKIDIKELKIKKCDINDLNEILNIQNIVISGFKEYEKGYFLPNSIEYYQSILNDDNIGEIYGVTYYDEMIAFIILSFDENLINKLISNLDDTYEFVVTIDGIMVLPEYRGNNLQVLLFTYLEKKIKELNYKNIIIEITYGNDYSLNNAQKLGYSIKGFYIKNKTIKRHLLIKKV